MRDDGRLLYARRVVKRSADRKGDFTGLDAIEIPGRDRSRSGLLPASGARSPLPSAGSRRLVRAVPLLAGLTAIAISVLVLLGWLLDVAPLTRIVASLPNMKPNTALGFIAAGVALICLREDASSRSRRPGRLLAALLAVFGMLVAAEWLFGGIGIDRLLFADAGSAHPGRPSPHTAVAFTTLGLALATVDARRGLARLHAALTALTAAIVLFAIVGYLFDVTYLRGVGGRSGLAIPSLVALAACTVGLMYLRPARGLPAILRGSDAGARLARTMLPIAVLAPLVFGGLAVEAQENGVLGAQVAASAVTLAMIVTLVTVLAVTARRLRRSDVDVRRLAGIVEASADAITSVDERGRFTSWNPGAAALLGYTREETLGEHAGPLVPDHRRDEFAEVLERARSGEAVFGVRTERRHRDGSLVDVEVTVSPLTDGGGAFAGMTAIMRDLRERKAAERRFQSLLEAAPDAMLIVDPEGRITLVNQAVAGLLGYERNELVGERIERLIPESVRAAHVLHRAAFAGDPHTRRMGGGLELVAVRKDGSEVPVDVSLSPLQTEAGMRVIAAVRDVTERRDAERALGESEERFRRSFEDSGIGMAIARPGRDLGRLLEVNEAFASITGYSSAELKQMSPLTMVHPDDQTALTAELRKLVDGSLPVVRHEVRLVGPRAVVVWAALTASLVRDAAGEVVHAIVQVQDVSERKRFEGQLQYLADHDALTGLFNRRRFEEELAREVASTRRYDTGGAVLVFDLDHFKYVNDSLGHAAGDELITIIGALLKRRVRDSDTVGRMGGDEFAVILTHSDEAQARTFGEGLLRDVREDMAAASVTEARRVTASLGIALFGGRPEVGPEELLAEADIAMYDAKEAGRDRLAVYDARASRHEQMQSRLAWVQRIEAALENDRFVLHAQPIRALTGEAELRYELLLRMLDDDDDLIPPGTFLYVAERHDLIGRIDRWVVAQAVELLAAQQARGRDVSFQVNLSATSVTDPAMLGFIAATVGGSRVDPCRLVFEVTETAAIVNIARAKTFVEGLRSIGCGFALDDFGAGFASFYYLKHLSFDYVKIDGEFIEDLLASHTNQLVVRSVVDIARGLGKQTMAEFVGDAATIELLRQYGIDYIQGYFVGRPVPLTCFDRPPGETAATRGDVTS